MSLRYSEPYKVPFYESDTFKNMRISNILATALQLSGAQSTLLGRSDVWLAQQYHLFWAVIDYEVEITRLPRFNEEISIATEATRYNNFFCYRDFWFTDAAGQELVKIHSTWVLMNQDTRKVERVADEIVRPYESEKISKIVRPHRFVKFDRNENIEKMIYPVRFSDLDMNGHVNNSKYYDWAADMLAYDFRLKHQPKRIFIKYNHEVLYGDNITAELVLDEQADRIISHHKINDNAAEIEIEWQKIQ